MPRTPGESREPWVKIKVGLRTSDKVGSLPSSAARWGWVSALLMAKTQRRMGVFAGRHHLRDLLGAEGRYVADYVKAGLVHEMPADKRLTCERCAHMYRDAEPGDLVIHDYRVDQRDPTNAERALDMLDRNGPTPSAQRTRSWRLRSAVFERDRYTCRYCGIDDYPREWLVAEHVIPDGPDTMENLVTACRPCNAKKGPHTPDQVGMTLRPIPGDVSPDGVTGHGDTSPDPVETHHERVTVTRHLTRAGNDGDGDGDGEIHDSLARTLDGGMRAPDEARTWLAQRGLRPTGGHAKRLDGIVERYGTPAVVQAMERAVSGGATGVRGVIFGAEDLLDRKPVATGQPQRLAPAQQEVRDAFRRS